jgi:hypothetical protein
MLFDSHRRERPPKRNRSVARSAPAQSAAAAPHRRPSLGRHRPAPGSSGARRAPRAAAATPLFAQQIRRPPPAAQSAAAAPHRCPTLGKDVTKGGARLPLPAASRPTRPPPAPTSRQNPSREAGAEPGVEHEAGAAVCGQPWAHTGPPSTASVGSWGSRLLPLARLVGALTAQGRGPLPRVATARRDCASARLESCARASRIV